MIAANADETSAPPPGVYVATLTFFREDETLDLPTLRSHVSRLVESGVAGIVVLGSNGEAVHLTEEERRLVTRTTREVLDERGRDDMPVIVGASAQSTRGCIELCRGAAEAGGSHVLVLPPSYYKAAMTEEVIRRFYMAVADASPLPVIIYSFPPVVNGIDVSSDLIVQVSQHPNVVGTKFTCGDTGKLARVARAMNKTRGKEADGYWAVGGLADFTLQALVVGGAGVVAGGGNLVPRVVVRVYELFRQGKLEEAMKLQSLLAEGDWVHTAAGIGGTKAVLQHYFSYGGVPRLPLTGPPAQTIDALMHGMSELIVLEKTL
jgi:L-threo-3-deoxy-hexylosonate aldolase